tara:strand:- start:63 stop:743 length:681 start_codon:yes stop_codon:yes gene_type:complete
MNKYNNYYYNSMLSALDTKVYQKNYKASTDNFISKGNKEDWINISTKQIELKKILSKIKPQDYNNKNRIYTYQGHVTFDKKLNCKILRSLIEIEPRFLKEIYDNAKRLKDEIKEEKLKSTKYKLLFEYKTQINKFNEILMKLKEEQKIENEKWDDLNHYYGSDDEYCDYDYLSEEEQINKTTEYNEKKLNLNLRISNILEEIKKIQEKINDIFENGISEDLIACNY